MAVLAFVFLFGGILLGCCTACINSCCADGGDGKWKFGGGGSGKPKYETGKHGAPQVEGQDKNNIQPVPVQQLGQQPGENYKKKEETGWLTSVKKNFKWLGFGNSPKPKSRPS
jgi:hypothetical protein